MEDLLERCPHCHAPEVPKHCVVRFEEAILQPLPETQWSALVADGQEELTPYREANVFFMIFSSSITRASNTKKHRTDCHHGVWSGVRQNESAGRAYMIGTWWSVKHEFSVEYCVPHWERLVAVMREENPLLWR
jgi:hypothetical protein